MSVPSALPPDLPVRIERPSTWVGAELEPVPARSTGPLPIEEDETPTRPSASADGT